MFEVSYPKINIDQIKYKMQNQLRSFSGKDLSNDQAQVVDKFDIPVFKQQIDYIEGFIETAESRAKVRETLPQSFNSLPLVIFKPLGLLFLKGLQFLFKDQREVNFNILEGLKNHLNFNRNFLDKIDFLQSYIVQKNKINQQKIENNDVLINHLIVKSDKLEKKSEQLQQQLNASQQNIENLTKQLNTSQQNIENLTKQLNASQQQYENYWQQTHYLRYDLNQQKRLITMFLENSRNQTLDSLEKKKKQTLVNEEFGLLDGFYLAFEDKFRGERQDIQKLQQNYFSILADAKINKENSVILDVGCGRGEWLELLKREGYTAKGIDINKLMVEQCCDRGLDVVETDVISYLQSLSDASINVITGFHIIEHLSFPILLQLFDEAVRVLQPGGCLIFETPNPANVWVGSHTFYFDPTHRNPLPSQMVKFVAEYQGLQAVKILNLNPIPDNQKLHGSDLAERFNQYFYSAQDYAIIGYKA